VTVDKRFKKSCSLAFFPLWIYSSSFAVFWIQ